jgi:hypothetical protein
MEKLAKTGSNLFVLKTRNICEKLDLIEETEGLNSSLRKRIRQLFYPNLSKQRFFRIL